MLDDDIQYLGTRLKPRDPPRFPQRSVAGLALHIEKSDGNDAHVLAFERDKSSTIHIGRRPGSELESRTLDQEKGRAMFRCAVVSRRHAKIAFSDSGHVYLIDLNSHHGTHVRKPGETSSRMLEPEIPTPLSDGDVVTFGKSVGRNEEMVRPIVARVELVYNGPSSSSIKPLVVPDSTLFSRSTSGRYGLHSPLSSSSDDAYSGQSDSYSDVEEIPPPGPTAAIPQTDSQSKPESHLGRAFEVLKRLLPPTTAPAAPRHESEPLIIDDPPPPQTGAVASSSSDLPPLWSLSNNRCSPLSLFPRYPLPLCSMDLTDNFFPIPPTLPPIISSDSSSPDDEGNHSRSESPMDLASPSPPPAEQQEPPVIAPRSNSPPASAPEAVAAPADKLLTTFDQLVEELEAQTRESHEARAIEAAAGNSTSSPPTTRDKEKDKEMVVDPDIYMTRVDYEELKMKHLRLQDEINNLQTQRRKYKSKFNSNVHTVTDKFSELEERLNDVNAQCALFMDQIESVTSVEVPDLQAQIDDLQDQQAIRGVETEELKRGITEWEDKLKEKETAPRAGSSNGVLGEGKIQEYSRTLQALIEELRLRATTERETKTELEAIRQLLLSILNEPSAPSSLKRKRSIDDEGLCDTEADNHHEEMGRPPTDGGVLMSTSPSHLPRADSYVPGLETRVFEGPAPRKRVRGTALGNMIMFGVGGVAVWSYLAYS